MNDQKYAKWDRWISYIVFTTKELIENRYIYKEVQKIIEKNQKLSGNNPFFHWVKNNYINNASMMICRLRDDHKDCISLYKLLEEIRNFPKILSRRRFIKVTRDIRISEKEANSLFDELTSSGNEHINPLYVGLDLKYFLEISEKIKDYRDNLIAHTDKRDFENWFCESELDECIDYIEIIVIKYRAFFRGVRPAYLWPGLKDNWKNIFKIYWIL